MVQTSMAKYYYFSIKRADYAQDSSSAAVIHMKEHQFMDARFKAVLLV